MDIVESEITDRRGRKFGWVGEKNALHGTFSELAKKRERGMAQMLQDARELEMRPDDIMVCTYAKSGTHWIWEIVNMVIKETADYDRKTKEVTMLEFQTPSSLDQMPSPRVLNCHLFADDLPLQIKSKKVKVIHVLRNPKDVAVSFFYFAKSLPLLLPLMENKPFETFSEFLPYFTGEYGVSKCVRDEKYSGTSPPTSLNGSNILDAAVWPNSVFEYYKQMEKYITDNPEQTLHLSFEDMKKNPAKAVEKVAQFLNKDLSRSIIEEIADKCSFNKLKSASETSKDHVRPPAGIQLANVKIESKHMYRKGEIGDWKNHFTVSENEQFDKLLEKHLENSSWEFSYS